MSNCSSCLRGCFSSCRAAVLGLVALLGTATAANAQVITGVALYTQYCANCHTNPAPGSRAPDREALAARTPESILDAITTGSMAQNASALNAQQKRILAQELTSRPLGSLLAGGAAAMKNRCEEKPLAIRAGAPMWSGWSPDVANTRFQPAAAAGLTAAQVPSLTLKWAFAFPNGANAFAQPAVANGRVYVGSDNGFFYALDAASGCVHWSYEAKASIRTAPSIGSTGGAGDGVFFGDVKGNVYAVNAATAQLIWTRHVDPHPLARVTGAPVLLDGRLYVPVASIEEAAGGNPTYECCTFRGGLVVYDARTGEEIWRNYTIAEPAKPTKKNSVGTQLYGPAGAAVWSAPTIDVERGAVYVATGNAYTQPAIETSDSVIAFDIKTGKVLWVSQVQSGDAYMIGCDANARTRDNCPDTQGPDFDFGNSPILRRLPNRQSVLVVGQKSGAVWALDPDKKGTVLWTHKVGRGSALGGLEWGSAADEQVGYFPVADAQAGPAGAGALYALRLATGEEVWHVDPPGANCAPGSRACTAARSAAITAIPGAVFSGTTDGMMRAYSANDGRVLWEFNTARDFETVNGVVGKGGSINGPGPVVVDGMVFTNSGYAYLGSGIPGNVLLAFGR